MNDVVEDVTIARCQKPESSGSDKSCSQLSSLKQTCKLNRHSPSPIPYYIVESKSKGLEFYDLYYGSKTDRDKVALRHILQENINIAPKGLCPTL